MKISKFFYIVVIAAFFSSPLLAQEYTINVQQFDVEEGLAHREIRGLLKDKDGFLWLATAVGLQRYDGYEFKSYPLDHPEGRFPPILRIAQSDDGWIWIQTGGQLNSRFWSLYFFNPITTELRTAAQHLDSLTNATLDSLNNRFKYRFLERNTASDLFFSAKDHFAKFSFSSGLQKTPISNSKDSPIMELAYIDKAQNFWAFDWTIDTFIKKINPSGMLVDSFPLKSYNASIYGLQNIYEWQNDTYLAQLNKNTHLVNDQLLKITEYGALESVFIAPSGYRLFQVIEGLIWCIGDEGWKIYDIAGNFITALLQENYAPALTQGLDYKRILADSTGKYYLPSDFGFTIINIQQSRFTQYFSDSDKTPLPFQNHARGIYVENDSVFVNFEYGGLVYFPKNQAENYQIMLQKFDGRPLIRDQAGSFWTGHSGHIKKWSADFTQSETIQFSDEFSNWTEATWSLYLGKNNCVWSGHSRALGKTCTEENKHEDLSLQSIGMRFKELGIYQIQNAGNDNLWLCTDKGLFLFSKKEQKILHRYYAKGQGENFLLQDNVFYLHIDQDQNRWIGTRSGLVFWNIQTGEKTLFDRNDGLSNNVIYAIFEDDYNRLWLSSDFGIMSFHKETHQVQSYLPRHGITHEEFNRISHFQEKDGTIYFGGLNGVTAFHPSDFIKETRNYAKMLLSDYEIFDGQAQEILNKTSEVIESKTITFHPNDRYFKIKFTLPTFDDIGRTLYAWKIDGVYDDWTYQKENSIQFGALPYGEYALKIKGQNADGGWSPHELTLTIKVLKPFYLKTWFIMASLFLIIAGAVLYYKARTRLLKAEITKATAKIAQQAEELRMLDKLKSRFFANVSHELRTPLALMLGPIRRLIKEDSTSDRNKQLLGFLERNTVHLKGLVNEILDLAKLENNKMELQEEATNFHDFISKHISQFYSIGNSENVIVNAQLNINEDLNILLDQNKFQKILNNFLSNAIKFSPPGGEILVKIQQHKKGLIAEVIDKGRGIHPDDLPYIFDRFYQSKVQDAPAEGGTGIGLSMCRELAQLMNGKVWAESRLGEGSSFYFNFPIKIAATTPQTSTTAASFASPTEITEQNAIAKNTALSGKILIAEDNADLREYYKIILSGYEVITKEHGQLALDYLQENEVPDLIISDLMMPVMDGMQFLNQLKNADQWRHIPVIMLTAKTSQQVKIEALRYGIDDYLNKPFDEEELLVRIHNLLQHQVERKVFAKKDKNIANNSQFSKADQQWLQSLEAYIINNITSDLLSVASLSSTFAMSESTLLRQLKKLTGLTPLKYLQELRLNYAKELILNKDFKTINEVAYTIGFKDANAFSRSFKKRFGKTPTDLV